MALLLIAFCGYCAFSVYNTYQPPGDWSTPLLYPEARNVVIEDFGKIGRFQDGVSGFLMRRITFTVAATPEQVRDYYQRELPKSNWQDNSYAGQIADAIDLPYKQARSSTTYYLEVHAHSGILGTEVQIDASRMLGY